VHRVFFSYKERNFSHNDFKFIEFQSVNEFKIKKIKFTLVGQLTTAQAHYTNNGI